MANNNAASQPTPVSQSVNLITLVQQGQQQASSGLVPIPALRRQPQQTSAKGKGKRDQQRSQLALETAALLRNITTGPSAASTSAIQQDNTVQQQIDYDGQAPLMNNSTETPRYLQFYSPVDQYQRIVLRPEQPRFTTPLSANNQQENALFLPPMPRITPNVVYIQNNSPQVPQQVQGNQTPNPLIQQYSGNNAITRYIQNSASQIPQRVQDTPNPLLQQLSGNAISRLLQNPQRTQDSPFLQRFSGNNVQRFPNFDDAPVNSGMLNNNWPNNQRPLNLSEIMFNNDQRERKETPSYVFQIKPVQDPNNDREQTYQLCAIPAPNNDQLNSTMDVEVATNSPSPENAVVSEPQENMIEANQTNDQKDSDENFQEVETAEKPSKRSKKRRLSQMKERPKEGEQKQIAAVKGTAVKPVMNHVIDGYLIQESSVPFSTLESSKQSVDDPKEVEEQVAEAKSLKTSTEIYEFITKIDGCAKYADIFMDHEIDGDSVYLLKCDHMVKYMNIPLGKALIIHQKIQNTLN